MLPHAYFADNDAGRWCAQFTFTDDEFSDPLGLAKVGADLSVMVRVCYSRVAAGHPSAASCCNRALRHLLNCDSTAVMNTPHMKT